MLAVKSSVLLITYVRLDTTKQVLASIKAYAPKDLYLFSDYGRSEQDRTKVDVVRNYLLESVDWGCNVHTYFCETNLGCKYGPEKAISWFFENEEQGIILEDDTVPNASFYTYATELLHKYKADLRIWNIGGTNAYFEARDADRPYSYQFSKFPHTWGWATWRDRWQQHINTLSTFIQDCNNPYVLETFRNPAIYTNWKAKAVTSYEDKLDAWDYIWSFRVLMNNGLSIVPAENLISNIGFGMDATHTGNKNSKIQESKALAFPLKHPTVILPRVQQDQLFLEEKFNWKTLPQKLKPKHLLKSLSVRLMDFH